MFPGRLGIPCGRLGLGDGRRCLVVPAEEKRRTRGSKELAFLCEARESSDIFLCSLVYLDRLSMTSVSPGAGHSETPPLNQIVY
jgi:hypothetical protein